jgi:hypothetical protein
VPMFLRIKSSIRINFSEGADKYETGTNVTRTTKKDTLDNIYEMRGMTLVSVRFV